MFDTLSLFINFIGLYALVCYLYEHLRTPFTIFKLRYLSDASERLSIKERYGAWAAITGSSDGIGKAYARELAREGINVVLVARNEQKLKAVADEISAQFKVETKIVIADFTEGVKVYEKLERDLDALPITILVNNVGIALPGSITKMSREQTQQLLDTNVMAVSHLSRYFFQRLRANKIKGAIVNVSSSSEQLPLPYAALYAASKAYTRSFTISLQWEAAPFGIHVQLLSPNFVVTKINEYSKLIMRGGLFIPSADEYARSAVAQLRDGVDQTPGYLWHHVQNAAFCIFPTALRMTISQKVLKYVVDKKELMSPS